MARRTCLAKSIGLDMSKYGACMDNDSQRAKVQSHLLEAERRGVNQTPTFVIGGTMTPGALPYDTFKKLVDDALAKAPTATDTSKGAKPAAAADSGAKPKAGAK